MNFIEKLMRNIKGSKKKKVKLINKENNKTKNINYGFDWWTLFFGIGGFAFIPSLLRGDILIGLILFVVQYLTIPLIILYGAGLTAIYPIIVIYILGSTIFIFYRCIINSRNMINRYKANGYTEIN